MKEKIYIFLPGRPNNIKRVVSDTKRYFNFELGLAFIYGRWRVVKRFLNRDYWHIPDESFDTATRDAVRRYKETWC